MYYFKHDYVGVRPSSDERLRVFKSTYINLHSNVGVGVKICAVQCNCLITTVQKYVCFNAIKFRLNTCLFIIHLIPLYIRSLSRCTLGTLNSFFLILFEVFLVFFVTSIAAIYTDLFTCDSPDCLVFIRLNIFLY